jgi:basic membrane protein A
MKHCLTAAVAILLAAATGLSGARAADKLKVGFVYSGRATDNFGWTYQHELARRALVKEFGSRIETTTLENVGYGLGSEQAIEQLAKAGNKLIFTTEFFYMEQTLKVAKKYPNVHFEHATGHKRDSNVSTYAGRSYEGRYVEGVIAAKMSKTGVIGYIGSFRIPQVLAAINATMLGAQSVNPNIKIKIAWANTESDSDKESDAANALIEQGVDVIVPQTSGQAPMKVAAAHGKLAFGQNSDHIRSGPKAQLTALLDNWTPYYVDRVKAELDGGWTSQDTWGGLKSRMVMMAPYTNMPDDVRKLAEDTEALIVAGKELPFRCPVIAQNGKPVLCNGGDRLSDDQLRSMNFYVRGIEDRLPDGGFYLTDIQAGPPGDTQKLVAVPAATPPPIAQEASPPSRTPPIAGVLAQKPAAPIAIAPAPPLNTDKRVALVIGDSAYQHVARLPNPQRDAAAVAAALRRVGFQSVTLQTDLSRDGMMQALRDFARIAEGADWAVIYFAGHGLEVGGVNYLIPVDANLASDKDVGFEAVPLEQLLNAAERATKLRLVILDACRNNPFDSQMKRTVATRAVTRGLARVEPDDNTMVVYAAKHGETAIDGSGGNSPFTTALIKNLDTPGLEVRLLFDTVRDDVMDATSRKQQPFSYGSITARQKFYFLAGK